MDRDVTISGYRRTPPQRASAPESVFHEGSATPKRSLAPLPPSRGRADDNENRHRLAFRQPFIGRATQAVFCLPDREETNTSSSSPPPSPPFGSGRTVPDERTTRGSTLRPLPRPPMHRESPPPSPKLPQPRSADKRLGLRTSGEPAICSRVSLALRIWSRKRLTLPLRPCHNPRTPPRRPGVTGPSIRWLPCHRLPQLDDQLAASIVVRRIPLGETTVGFVNRPNSRKTARAVSAVTSAFRLAYSASKQRSQAALITRGTPSEKP